MLIAAAMDTPQTCLRSKVSSFSRTLLQPPLSEDQLPPGTGPDLRAAADAAELGIGKQRNPAFGMHASRRMRGFCGERKHSGAATM